MQRTAPPRSFALRAIAARRRLLQMHYESKVGHIGGNLSALDAVLYLHAVQMNDDDTFVLSKGHAAGALYVALWSIGLIDEAELATFHQDATHLAGHPAPKWHERIAFATGSLGHGLGLAAGVALGKRLRGDAGRVYCLLSDGECQEGSTWEALLFARHHALSNLTVMIDGNGLQGFGSTQDIMSMGSLADKFRGLGLEVAEIDGHCDDAIAGALGRETSGPRIIAMRTVKGRGISFMENRMEWHYLPLDEAQYQQALVELATSELKAMVRIARKPRRRAVRERAAA